MAQPEEQNCSNNTPVNRKSEQIEKEPNTNRPLWESQDGWVYIGHGEWVQMEDKQSQELGEVTQ